MCVFKVFIKKRISRVIIFDFIVEEKLAIIKLFVSIGVLYLQNVRKRLPI